jgi:hypothetical protein
MLEEGALEVCALPEELLLQSSVPERELAYCAQACVLCHKGFGGVCLFTQY